MNTSFAERAKFITQLPEIGFEMVNFVCGDLIGAGGSREVYEYNLDPKFVVKIDVAEDCGDNIVEWRIWNIVRHTTDGTKDWFAECTWISTNGRIMLQRKTKPLHTKYDKIPDKIPAYFTDIKESNFGWIGDNLVCHDYALSLERFSYFALKNKMQSFKNKL